MKDGYRPFCTTQWLSHFAGLIFLLCYCQFVYIYIHMTHAKRLRYQTRKYIFQRPHGNIAAEKYFPNKIRGTHLNSFIRRHVSAKSSHFYPLTFCVQPLLALHAGNPPKCVIRAFPTQRDSNIPSMSMLWHKKTFGYRTLLISIAKIWSKIMI